MGIGSRARRIGVTRSLYGANVGRVTQLPDGIGRGPGGRRVAERAVAEGRARQDSGAVQPRKAGVAPPAACHHQDIN
jgi:hypothetical protein